MNCPITTERMLRLLTLPLRRLPRAHILLGFVILALAIPLAACEDDGEEGGETPPVTAPELEDGVLRVGSDISYPPFESFPEGMTTPTGIDVDLARALGEALGVEVEFQDIDLDSRIPSLEAGQVDVIISAMTITEERRQRIDFIPYFRSGTGILVPGGNPTGIRNDYNLCLHTVAVEEGTIQLDQLEALNTSLCAGEMNIRIKTYDRHSPAVTQLRAGSVDAVLADYPVALNDVLLSGGGLEVIDFQILPVTYGIGVRMDSDELKEAITQALRALMEDGSYDGILYKWGARAGIWKEVAS